MADAPQVTTGQAPPTPAATTTQGTPTAPAPGSTPPVEGTVLTQQSGDKAAPDAGAKAETTPGDFVLKFPDGVEADNALLGEFTQFAKELKLEGATAQKSFEHLLKSRAAVQAGLVERAAEAHRQRVAEWTETLKSDKEVGGANFDQNVIVAKKALTKFGGPEFTEFLNKTGLGSHPEMVKLMYRVGKAISEDSITGTTGTVTAAPQQSTEERLKSFYNKSPGLFKP